MTKNIIIAILVIVNIFFVVLSNIKANEAEKAMGEAEANAELVKQVQLSVDFAEKEAVGQAAGAAREKAIADSLVVELKACKK